MFHTLKDQSTMLNFIVKVSTGMLLLFSVASCSSHKISASGIRYKPLSEFNFAFNNNQTNISSLYKKYTKHNKKHASHRKRNKSNSIAKKGKRTKSDASKPLMAVGK